MAVFALSMASAAPIARSQAPSGAASSPWALPTAENLRLPAFPARSRRPTAAAASGRDPERANPRDGVRNIRAERSEPATPQGAPATTTGPQPTPPSSTPRPTPDRRRLGREPGFGAGQVQLPRWHQDGCNGHAHGRPCGTSFTLFPHSKGRRPVQWLTPWRPEALELKPFEPVLAYDGCQGFFWCPEEKGDQGRAENSGDGEADQSVKTGEEGRAAEKQGEETNVKGNQRDEGARTLTPLMQLFRHDCPSHFERMQGRGDRVYGWVWAGFTGNFASPRDRINFGTNFNWRSNDYRVDQVYLVYENPLEHEKRANVGYRVDFYAGHQSPFLVENGLFGDFTGFDVTSGYGVEGPPSFRQLNRIGIDLPQFFLNAHIPYFLAPKGIDVLFGKFWTLMGHEYYPGPLTDFYSHSYEIVYGTPFTHTGVLTTVHATDTWDVTAGIVRGQDVFEDNNDRPSYTGNFVWNSCDRRCNWTTAWITGPEQFRDDGNYRTVLTSYVTRNFGDRNQWRFVTGGILAFEANAVPDSLTGTLKDAQWYGYTNYLFYTIDPKTILGTRVEWFRDDDGVRTAVTRRPGFAGNFFEVTLGVTYKPYQNLRFRPEIRFDWFDGRAINGTAALPYNDQRDSFQTTAAIDVIWEF